MDNIKILKFAEDLHSDIEKIKKELPYSINVIDELHINENAHSRILYKLLLYKNDEGKYEILESLINYIINHYRKSSFKKIHVEDPIITQEEQRIDLWVRDNNYAIIIENKVYNAVDQENQISRYIDKTKEDSSKGNYKDGSNIYIIYLSQTGKEPEEQTWKDYKEEFKDRYINLSYRYSILNWLTNTILPNIKYKDMYLKYALLEYIDYLNGFFGLRKNQYLIKMEANKEIESFLNLSDIENQEKINKLRDALSNIDALKNSLYEYLQSVENNISKRWKEEIEKEFPQGLNFTGNKLIAVTLPSPTDQKEIYVTIWKHDDTGILSCEVGRKGQHDFLNKKDH